MSVKVVIDTPGPTITIEAEGDLADIAAKALELFHAAGGWPNRHQPIGFNGLGASTERAGGPEYVSGHQIDMGRTT